MGSEGCAVLNCVQQAAGKSTASLAGNGSQYHSDMLSYPVKALPDFLGWSSKLAGAMLEFCFPLSGGYS
jgi:hypothetical protein